MKAVNSRDRNFTRAKLVRLIASADERLDDYLAGLDRADRSDQVEDRDRAATMPAKLASLRERRDRHAALLGELAASGETQISFTDPDIRAMATHPKVGVGYNAQVAVNAKHS